MVHIFIFHALFTVQNYNFSRIYVNIIVIFLRFWSDFGPNLPQMERIGRIFFCFGQKGLKEAQKMGKTVKNLTFL